MEGKGLEEEELVLAEVQVPEKEGKNEKRKGWASSGPGGAAAPWGLNNLGVSQGRIHSTESPNPTPSPLRETAGGQKETAGATQHDKEGD